MNSQPRESSIQLTKKGKQKVEARINELQVEKKKNKTNIQEDLADQAHVSVDTFKRFLKQHISTTSFFAIINVFKEEGIDLMEGIDFTTGGSSDLSLANSLKKESLEKELEARKKDVQDTNNKYIRETRPSERNSLRAELDDLGGDIERIEQELKELI